MKCAYCLEEMNEGATVCRVCHRTQPRSFAIGGRNLLFAIAAIVLLAAGIGAYFIFKPISEEEKIANLSRCMTGKGIPDASENDIREQIDKMDSMVHRGRQFELDIIKKVTGCP
jgi:hypothetical protein